MTGRTKRGFTYAEMLVVLTVLVVLSSILTPRLDAWKRGRELRSFKLDVRNLALEARVRALSTGDTVALGYDKGEREIFALHEGSDGKERRVGAIVVPESISATQFSSDREESPDDGWRVPFFPDGSSAGGGIEFEAYGETFNLAVHRQNGLATVTEGEIPDLSLETWPAGGYEPRV